MMIDAGEQPRPLGSSETLDSGETKQLPLQHKYYHHYPQSHHHHHHHHHNIHYDQVTPRSSAPDLDVVPLTQLAQKVFFLIIILVIITIFAVFITTSISS